MPHSRNKLSEKSNSTSNTIPVEHAGNIGDSAQLHGSSFRSRQGTVSSNGEEGISRTSTNASVIVNTAWKRRWDNRMEATKLFDPENRTRLLAMSSTSSVPLALPAAEQTVPCPLSPSSPAPASFRSGDPSDPGAARSESRYDTDKAPSGGNISVLNLPSNLRLDKIQPLPDLEQEIMQGLCDSPLLRSSLAGSSKKSPEGPVRAEDSRPYSKRVFYSWSDDRSAVSLTPNDSVSQYAYPIGDELQGEPQPCANDPSHESPKADPITSLKLCARPNDETVDHTLETWLHAIDQAESAIVEPLRVDSKCPSGEIPKDETDLKPMENTAQVTARDVMSRARLELAKDLVRLSSVFRIEKPGDNPLSLSNIESDDLTTIEQCLQQIEAVAGANRRQRFVDLTRRLRIVFAKTFVSRVGETETSVPTKGDSSDDRNLREQQRLRSLARLEGRLVGPRTPSVRSEAMEGPVQTQGLGIHISDQFPGAYDGRVIQSEQNTPRRLSVASKQPSPGINELSRRSSQTSSGLSMLLTEQATFRHMARLAAYQHDLQMSNRFLSPANNEKTSGSIQTEDRYDGIIGYKSIQQTTCSPGGVFNSPGPHAECEKLLVKPSPKHDRFVPERDSQFIRDLREVAQQRTAKAAVTPPSLKLAHPALRNQASPSPFTSLSPEKVSEHYNPYPSNNSRFTPNLQQAREDAVAQSNVDLRKRAVRNLQESTHHRVVGLAGREMVRIADGAAHERRNQHMKPVETCGAVSKNIMPSRSGILSQGKIQQLEPHSSGVIPTDTCARFHRIDLDKDGAVPIHTQLDNESPRTSIHNREHATDDQTERLQVEEDLDEAMNHWANIPESPSASNFKPKDLNVEYAFQELRHALRIPLLRNRSECERPHPNHPYQWDTVKLMCQGSHSSFPPNDIFSESNLKSTSVNSSFSSTPTAKLKECGFCSETCCYYKRLTQMVNVLHIADGSVSDLKMRVSGALEELRRTYPDGIEDFETLMECWYCSRVFCPKCGFVCKQLFCRQPICKDCHTTEDSCQGH